MKIIYIKDFGETYFILSLSHAGFDWLYLNEDMDEINNDILKYKR